MDASIGLEMQLTCRYTNQGRGWKSNTCVEIVRGILCWIFHICIRCNLIIEKCSAMVQKPKQASVKGDEMDFLTQYLNCSQQFHPNCRFALSYRPEIWDLNQFLFEALCVGVKKYNFPWQKVTPPYIIMFQNLKIMYVQKVQIGFQKHLGPNTSGGYHVPFLLAAICISRNFSTSLTLELVSRELKLAIFGSVILGFHKF